MSEYIKQNFTSGQILKAEHLNNMEIGIESNATAIRALSEEISETSERNYIKLIDIQDNSAYLPGLVICYTETGASLVELFRDTTKCMPVIKRRVATKPDTNRPSFYVLQQAYAVDSIEGGYLLRVHFGDKYPDILANSVDDTITLDPEWIAPAEPVVIPDTTESNMHLATDENGNKVWVKNPTYVTTDEVNSLIAEALSTLVNAEEVSY